MVAELRGWPFGYISRHGALAADPLRRTHEMARRHVRRYNPYPSSDLTHAIPGGPPRPSVVAASGGRHYRLGDRRFAGGVHLHIDSHSSIQARLLLSVATSFACLPSRTAHDPPARHHLGICVRMYIPSADISACFGLGQRPSFHRARLPIPSPSHVMGLVQLGRARYGPCVGRVLCTGHWANAPRLRNHLGRHVAEHSFNPLLERYTSGGRVLCLCTRFATTTDHTVARIPPVPPHFALHGRSASYGCGGIQDFTISYSPPQSHVIHHSSIVFHRRRKGFTKTSGPQNHPSPPALYDQPWRFCWHVAALPEVSPSFTFGACHCEGHARGCIQATCGLVWVARAIRCRHQDADC